MTITKEMAHQMGATGSPAVEHERLLFEAWMRGHCWEVTAIWDGNGYVGSSESHGNVCLHAMHIRQLWAVWRDRAALAATAPTVAVDGITDTDRMDYVAAAHLGGSYAGIASINPIIHLDDYRLGGARYAIDCMIERKTGRAQGGHVDASESGVSPVPKGASGGHLGGPKTAGVAIPDGECECRRCLDESGATVEIFPGMHAPISGQRMVLCQKCGNKRCPHANDHRNACTGSNEPGQAGSAYPAAPSPADQQGE